jgi:hypothetical protein
MKIAIKRNKRVRIEEAHQPREINIIYVHFPGSERNDNFYFNTIDYDRVLDYNPNDYFFDQISIYSSTFYVIHLDKRFLVLVPQESFSALRSIALNMPIWQVDPDEFNRALNFIAEDNDFSYLNNEALIPTDLTLKINEENSTDLPSLTDYVSSHLEEFKTIYYPGAGLDFSPLQLFGLCQNDPVIYFTDYMRIPELERIIQRLDKGLESWKELFPENFNKSSWDDFWPTNSLAWNEEYHHPRLGWGRKYQFSWEDKNCTFCYLGTEGVQTAAILIENNIIPDVLVLQDHGYSTNYDLFSGPNSPLYQVMKDNIPNYILIDTSRAGNTVPWPNYVQVTKTYQPPVFMSLSQNQDRRALFKRIK